MLSRHFSALLFSCCLVILFTSCEKYDKYNNTNNIKTPFSMIVGGDFGSVNTTNDGKVINVFSFGFGSGMRVRDVLVADTNTLVLTGVLRLFKNLPKNDFTVLFNNNVQNDGFNKMIVDRSNNFVWFCAKDGLYWSRDNGINWRKDSAYDDGYNAGFPIGSYDFSNALFKHPTSITITDDNTVYILQDSFIFKKAPGELFKYVKSDPLSLLDTVTWWVISSYQNNLVAFDTTGEVPVKYSSNGGISWTTTSGMPLNKKILFAKSPKYNTGRLYCGTDSAGLYELKGSNFERFTGLNDTKTRYFDIEGKTNTYMSGLQKFYFYLATSDGLYESENSGTDWRLKNATAGFSALW